MLPPTEECSPGSGIGYASRCDEAKFWAMSLGLFPQRDPKVGSWSDVPLGCAAQVGIDDTIHFNARSATNNKKLVSGEFVMICEAGL